MPDVKQERSGWRDEGLSRRHREWGWDCPAVDIDFLMVEYDVGQPVAIVEYKHWDSPPQELPGPKNRSMNAICALGSRAGVPVFGCRYSEDFTQWLVVPLNGIAMREIAERQEMTEGEWIAFLYKLRSRLPPCQ